MARRRQRVRFSLFAFQDIITGLCGVLILLVMLMLVDFMTTPESNTVETTSTEEINGGIESLRCEIVRLEKELANARESSRNAIISVKDAAAPEQVARLTVEMTAKEKELAALVSQVEDLRTRVAAARDADARSRNTVREMEETRRLLERKVSALKNEKGITLIPERGAFKIPVYIVCGGDGVEIMCPLKTGSKTKRFSKGGMEDGVIRVLGNLDHTTHTVILLVRPSGTGMMKELADLVKKLGFSCGRDPLEEDAVVSLAATGGDA